MDNWQNRTINEAHIQAIQREAERIRLAKALLEERPRRPFFAPLLAALGRGLVWLGRTLQAQYEAVPAPRLQTR